MNLVIQFTPDGNGRCLWTEEIPLATLGQLKITRASSIEYNNALDRWEVKLASEPDRVAYASASRHACLQWEVNELNARLCEEGAQTAKENTI